MRKRAGKEPSHRVFISYTRSDGERIAERLQNRLERKCPEILVWRDRTNMEAGAWRRQIYEAMDKAQTFVLVVTPNIFKEGAFTLREWQYARKHGVDIVPVRGRSADSFKPENMPRWMREQHIFDIDNGGEWESFVRHLRTPREHIFVPARNRLPWNYVERPEQLKKILKYLLSKDHNSPKANNVAIVGPPGYGKSTLAEAVCDNDDIVTAFDDGILWVTLGTNPNICDALARLCRSLSGEQISFCDEEDASENFADTLEERHCLIVIDDVWNPAHLRPFLRGGENCARIITAGRLEAVLGTEMPIAIRVDVEKMTETEAVQVLAANLKPRPQRLDIFRRIARRLDEWPLLLGLANAALVKQIERGKTIDGAVESLNDVYERYGPSKFDTPNAIAPADSIRMSMEVSLSFLDAKQRGRYESLGIFPENPVVPLTTLGALWGLDDLDTELLAGLLDSLFLIKLDLRERVIQLSEVFRKYLFDRLSDAAALHRRVLERWGDPSSLPDGYAWRNVAFHLVNAGRARDLRRLLLDYHWIQAKLEATDIDALIADYAYFPDDLVLKRIRGALRLSAHVLAREKQALAGQLHGRLLDTGAAEIRRLLQAAHTSSATWLRPLRATLTTPGGPLLRTFSGHRESIVLGLAFTRDGQNVISGADDDTLKIWSLESGPLPRTLEGHKGWVMGLDVTADGQSIVSASDDGTLAIWDIEKGRKSRVFRGHADGVMGVAVTPDGRRILSASLDMTLRIWELGKKECVSILTGHTGGVWSVAVTPDSKYAVSGSEDCSVKVWDLRSGKLCRTFMGHKEGVNAVTVSPGAGRFAVSASDDHTLNVWDLANQDSSHAYRCLTGHTHRVKSVAITPDGRFVVSASQDRSIRFWDIESGRQVEMLTGHANTVEAVIVSPDGRFVVSGSADETIKIWDMELIERRIAAARVPNFAPGQAISTDGRIAIYAEDDHSVRVRDIVTGESIASFGCDSAPYACAVAPDGRTFVVGEESGQIHFLQLEKPGSVSPRGPGKQGLRGSSARLRSKGITPRTQKQKQKSLSSRGGKKRTQKR